MSGQKLKHSCVSDWEEMCKSARLLFLQLAALSWALIAVRWVVRQTSASTEY